MGLVCSQVPTDQPQFAQDMIERWMANALYSEDDRACDSKLLLHKQLDECKSLANPLVHVEANSDL